MKREAEAGDDGGWLGGMDDGWITARISFIIRYNQSVKPSFPFSRLFSLLPPHIALSLPPPQILRMYTSVSRYCTAHHLSGAANQPIMDAP
jgi:hypothetical protein